MNALSFFSSLMGLIDPALNTVVTQGITNSIAYVAGWMVYALALAIVFLGLALAFGISKTPAGSAAILVLKAAFVIAIGTQATYGTWIQDLINVALPHDIAQIAGASPTSTAHSFDVILNQALDACWTVYNQMSAYDVRRYALILIYLPIALAAVGFSFGVYLLGHLAATIYVAFGPAILPLFLFSGTRPIFTAWAGITLSAVALQLIAVMFALIVVGLEGAIVRQIVSTAGADLQMQTGLLFCAGLMFLLCAWFALHLPSVAAALCGGIHYSPRALTQATFGAVTKGAGAAASLGHEKLNQHVQAARARLSASSGSASSGPASPSPPGPSASRSTAGASA